jgi:D-alanyl-D-alanine carboxypeptidase
MGSLAISQNGKVIYNKAIGKADIETNKDISTESKFRIGSISKTFTATLIFKAIDEKKITLNQTISKFFPTVKNANKITVANLLNHHSGIFNFTNSPDYLKWSTAQKTREELVSLISANPSNFEPNSKAEYSNSNYVLLSIILEKIYQKPYKDILKEKIINPLKLANTYYGDKINLANNEVNSYSFNGTWKRQPQTDMSIPLGAGAIVSNPNDLNKFIASLLDGELVSSESLGKMKTITDKYGMGLTSIPYYDKEGFGHGGAIDGFTSLLYYFPADKLAIAITSNGNNYNNNQILVAGLGAFYNKPFDIPTFKVIALKPEDLDQYLGTYAAPNFPMKISITKRDNILVTQATGQEAIEMKALSKNTFEFAAAGIILEFNPSLKQMLLKQGGAKYVLTKE